MIFTNIYLDVVFYMQYNHIKKKKKTSGTLFILLNCRIHKQENFRHGKLFRDKKYK